MELKYFLLFLCSATCMYCLDPCKYIIVTDFNHGDCEKGFSYYYTNDSKNCLFSRCIKTDIDQSCSDTYLCPAGTICKEQLSQSSKCRIDEKSCFKYHVNYTDNQWYTAMEKPICLQDGTWNPKQFKGESTNRRYLCYNPQGRRIYGQIFSTNDKAESMNCACSQRREELLRSSQIYPILHCDLRGNYEILQCNSEHCWCVQEKTGEIISQVLPEKLIKYLPCYSKEDEELQYLRQCDSEKYAQSKIENELNIHGTTDAEFSHLLCDGDGSYGAYQVSSSRLECRWRNNTVLGQGINLNEINGGIDCIDCNCLRDKMVYELENLDFNKECYTNGSYSPLQTLAVNGAIKFYCVDKDGFRKSDFFENNNKSYCYSFI